MIGTLVGHYKTMKGHDGVMIYETTDFRGDKRYSYTGKWGAGSGHDLAAMSNFLSSMLRHHPRHYISLNFWPAEQCKVIPSKGILS